MSGRIVHFEIPFDNEERATAFYREAFGWQLQKLPEMDYTTVSTGPVTEQGMPTQPGFINGGMMRREGAFTGPTVVVDVDDIDATLKRVNDLGGSVVLPKQAVGDMGHVAYLKDPEGNVIGLWENA